MSIAYNSDYANFQSVFESFTDKKENANVPIVTSENTLNINSDDNFNLACNWGSDCLRAVLAY